MKKIGNYLDYLYNQFGNSLGFDILNRNVDPNEFMSAFFCWIKKNQLIGDRYRDFVNYMDVKPSHENNVVEVGKGKFDSIALNLNLPIITEFSAGMTSESYSPIISKEFVIVHGKPVLFPIFDGSIDAFPLSSIDRFMTHNPYSEYFITDWPDLHNNGGNITIGVFGDIHDKDKESKIKMLKELRNKMLLQDLKDEYGTDGDMYFYAIASNRKVKILEQKKLRYLK